jgi:hypothetical protein
MRSKEKEPMEVRSCTVKKEASTNWKQKDRVEVNHYEKINQNSHFRLRFRGGFSDHGVCQLFLEGGECGQFLRGDDECDCDEYIGKERDGRRADRTEGRGGDVYGGGGQRDIYREGL